MSPAVSPVSYTHLDVYKRQVYDPETKEVVIGAQVTATGEGGTFTAVTDDWGDFWLRGLPDADWTVTIEAGGKRKVVETSTKEKDQGLGDIALA